MSKMKTVVDLRKGQKFLDIWGYEWKKTSGKKDRRCLAERGGEMFSFHPDFPCFTGTFEEALEDIKDQIGMPGNANYCRERREAMMNPHAFFRKQLSLLVDSAGMSFNGSSVDLREGIYRLLRACPPILPEKEPT